MISRNVTFNDQYEHEISDELVFINENSFNITCLCEEIVNSIFIFVRHSLKLAWSGKQSSIICNGSIYGSRLIFEKWPLSNRRLTNKKKTSNKYIHYLHKVRKHSASFEFENSGEIIIKKRLPSQNNNLCAIVHTQTECHFKLLHSFALSIVRISSLPNFGMNWITIPTYSKFQCLYRFEFSFNGN